MQNLPPDLVPRSRQLLLPLVATEDDREALLTDAFYTVSDSRIYHQIKRDGSPMGFTTLCIKKLLDYGCLAEGQHALGQLLQTTKFYCGIDKHPSIDELVKIANTLCAEIGALPSEHAVLEENAELLKSPTQTIATPRDERTPTIFISYSHTDTDFAQSLIADLNKAGHACWIDTSEIKGGDEWIMTIAEGIINSYAFVPVVTLKALKSKWVQDEILWAKNKNKLIIPIILENVLDEVRFFPLVSYQGITLFDSDYQTTLAKLLSYLPKPTLADVVLSEDDLAEEDADSPETIAISATRTIPRKVELAYMERLKLEELLNTEKYTAMGGTAQIHRKAEMRAVFELIKVGRNEEQFQQEIRKFENAVDEIQAIQRCVLLGEPGGGKTTTIWKLAAELVDTALNTRQAVIPLLIRLGKWTDADQSLSDFIKSQLGDLGEYLEVLLSEKRAALLLDGLNELPASQHNTKYPLVQQFIEENPDLLAVVSCRELDYTIDLGFDKINITPLDPMRIREFAERYIGAAKGHDLFWKLAGEKAQNYHTDFINKVEQEHEPIFWLANMLPENIKWTYDWDNKNEYSPYWSNWLQERENPSGLMVLARNPYMLLMLTSVYADEGELPANRGQLFAKFVETLLEREDVPDDEQEPLINGLAQVAYEMQVQRGQSDDGNALTVLPQAIVKAILGERLLYLAGSASILSIGEQIRFTHQLLQEYFAATYMDIMIFSPRSLGDGSGVRALQAKDIWNPENWWERTNWEEATILLAGLYSDDCTQVVEWVNEANPEVAALCVTRSGAALADNTKEKLRAAWIPRLTNLESDPDPHARAAIGHALGLTNWDNRRGVNCIEIEVPRPEGEGFRVRAIPDIDWVEIPAGEFTYQDNEKVYLPAYKMSRYPVTYAQFQSFVDAEDGYQSQEYDWFEGLAADEDDRQIREQSFKYWNHPRETVNWYQAIAFCRWLSHQLWSTGTFVGT